MTTDPQMNPMVKCPVCGAPYRFYAMMVGEQDVCPDCRVARDQAAKRPTPEQEDERARRRRAAFG